MVRSISKLNDDDDRSNAIAIRAEIVEMVRKFLITGVPMVLSLYSSTAVTSMYGTIVIGLSAMVYSGNDAYSAAADRYLMLPTQVH